MKKIILLLLIMGSIALYFILNQPPKSEIQDLYLKNETSQIMDIAFIESTRNVSGYDLIAENNFLKLFMNDRNSHFAVVDKRNDYVWYSNYFTSDPKATKTYQNLQKSTFSLRYRETDNTTKLMTNYEYSIQNQQFEIDLESVEDGFRIDYTVADRSPKGYWFPTKISKERFEELIYNPFVSHEFESPAQYTELDRYLRNAYKPLEDDPNTYILALVTGDKTSSDLVGTDISYLYEILYEIGHYGNKQDELGNYIEEYHFDDVNFDNDMYGYEVEIKDPEFFIPMTVKLTEDSVVATIITEEIVAKEPYDIISINFLPYFGAANETKEGYMVIPEGSGGIINFTNGKTQQRSYTTYLYDQDHTLIPAKLSMQDVGAKMPIYGLKHENNAILAVIEGGAEHAMLTAEISGKNDRFNKIMPEFTFKDSGLYYLTQSGISIWNEDTYDYQPEIRYYFTEGEDANYTGLAHVYKDYLQMKYDLEVLENKKTSLYLDILGSYDFDDYFLFFPYKRVETLTTYRQAQTMIESLKNQGVNHMVANYKGWFNKGMEHERPDHINLDSSLGTKKAFQAFNRYMEEQGYPLFYDVEFMKLYDKSSLYNNANISRIVGGTMMEYYPYDQASRLPIKTEDPYYLLKLSAIDENIEGFLRDANKLELPGINLTSLGQELYSDFHKNHQLYRYEAVDYIMDMMQNVKDHTSVMVTSSNDYALPFADYLVDLTYQTSNYLVVDYAIPFYQMAISGMIDYAMPSINLGQNEVDQYYVLKALETGSNLKFTVSYEDTSQLINTRFNNFFSTEFSLIENNMVQLYQELYNVIGDDNYIISHEVTLAGEVVVTYVKGQVITINYQNLTYTVQ
ncbi:MAG: hypothetical protein A2Y45_08015 [Tenericutes bacterium GWC2_34_14]|nr:MAG: hypothetical protein A2Y45_08015 [Tenericutes bacterium GWC2_34_14]OHE34822.1 MAG: hypothetical protein A2012_01625 [Tenericutes bacterium GWE2_34_108]OHE37317.1 MAG: hypothetical protein A2Y46_01385 [Tenericutes bacterium GWF1_35_14]OHE39550.1 MAG: hypothetical protein A2Y44_01475 [Tenericutes bacterium GWF2_35_184]OHE43182.1 MAG: hypothetical protein A3K26_03130 [Tenericutes bacterium RIFOXYA12_FULL_35_10]OHE44261.1 MAG: hypothetical protein A2221_04035 [Tenericutes bacterium RIFOXYA